MARHDVELVDLLLARFPAPEGRIRELLRDDDFRELCGDYAECLDAEARLRATGARVGTHVDQYGELQAHLERELLIRLMPPRCSGGPGRGADRPARTVHDERPPAR